MLEQEQLDGKRPIFIMRTLSYPPVYEVDVPNKQQVIIISHGSMLERKQTHQFNIKH